MGLKVKTFKGLSVSKRLVLEASLFSACGQLRPSGVGAANQGDLVWSLAKGSYVQYAGNKSTFFHGACLTQLF